MKIFSMALIVQKKESSTRSSLKTASTRQTDLTVFSLFLQNAVVVCDLITDGLVDLRQPSIPDPS